MENYFYPNLYYTTELYYLYIIFDKHQQITDKNAAQNGVYKRFVRHLSFICRKIVKIAMLGLLADDRLGVDALALVVVGKSGTYSLLCENGAVYLLRRKSLERFDNCLVGKAQSVVDRLALYHFGCDGRSCDRCAAAEGLELTIGDSLCIVIDLDVHLHYIAALCVADLADTVCVFDFTNVSRVCEMVHYFIAV